MLNEQVAGMLRNNAGNPDIVRRIAEENQLSQTEVAQTLRIPEESAARYMPGMTPERGMESGPIDGGMVKPAPMPTPMPTPMATKPGMQPPQVPMAGGAPSSAGSAGGGMASVSAPSLAGSAANAMTAGSAGGGMQMGSAGGMQMGSAGGMGEVSIDQPPSLTPQEQEMRRRAREEYGRQSQAQPGREMIRRDAGSDQMGRGGFSPAITPQMSQPFPPAGGMSTPVKPGSIPQMSQPLRPPMGEMPSQVGGSGFGNIPGNRPQTQTKPLPASMKPQGLVAPPPVAGFRGPARVPSAMPQPASSAVQRKAPAAPAPAAARPRAPARVPTADQAFMSGFNRVRGARA